MNLHTQIFKYVKHWGVWIKILRVLILFADALNTADDATVLLATKVVRSYGVHWVEIPIEKHYHSFGHWGPL